MKNGKFKKALALALTTVCAAGALAGCGGGDTASDGVTVVRWWTNDGGGSKVWKELVEEYNNTQGKKDNIKIEYTLYADTYGEILETALESKQAAEIVVNVGDIRQRVANGQLMAFDDLPGWENVQEEYADYLIENSNLINGKVYSIPYNATTFGLMYNEDMFKAAGIVDENGEAKPPATWDEFVEDAKKLTNPSKNEYGLIMPMKWGGYWTYDGVMSMQPSLSTSAGLNRENMKFEYENFAPFFEALMQIKKDGSYYPGPEGFDNDPARAQFAMGNVGMKFAASWDVGVLKDQFPAECDWNLAPYPVVNADERYWQPVQYGTIASPTTCIAEEKLEAVGKVLRWMYSDEVALALYENEINIPVKPGITDKADESKMSKQWITAGKLLTISSPYNTGIKRLPTELSIKYSMSDTEVYSKIWSEGADIQSSLKTLSEAHTKDMEEAFEAIGENPDDYKLEPGFRPKVTWEN